jgi:hypothetical protein
MFIDQVSPILKDSGFLKRCFAFEFARNPHPLFAWLPVPAPD